MLARQAAGVQAFPAACGFSFFPGSVSAFMRLQTLVPGALLPCLRQHLTMLTRTRTHLIFIGPGGRINVIIQCCDGNRLHPQCTGSKIFLYGRRGAPQECLGCAS